MLYNVEPKQVKKILITNGQNNYCPYCVQFLAETVWTILKEEVWHTTLKSTKEMRLRVLGWKKLHDIYPTNILFNKMNVKESDKYTFCPDKMNYIIETFCYDSNSC